jgi:hypothetical protein
MTTKELAAHLRNRITVAGVKGARVRMAPGLARVIQVFPAGGSDVRFSDEDQVTIATIAVANGLTFTRGLPIIVEQNTYGAGFTFEQPY